MRYTTVIRFFNHHNFANRIMKSQHDSIHSAVAVAEWGMREGAEYAAIKTADGEVISGTSGDQYRCSGGELQERFAGALDGLLFKTS